MVYVVMAYVVTGYVVMDYVVMIHVGMACMINLRSVSGMTPTQP